MADVDEATLAAAMDDLYVVPPQDFVARRDALVKELRADGATEAAATVKGLARPTAAAYAANLLVREERVQVDQLLALGDELRRAQRQLSGEQLRELTTQRRTVVRSLAARAAALAAEAGVRLPAGGLDKVAATLDAALADPRSAELLLAGRLTTELTYVGLGAPDAAPTPVLHLVREGSDVDEESGEHRGPSAAERRAALRDAQRDVDAARADLEAAQSRLGTAREASDAASLRVASAQEALAAVQAELEAAEEAEEAAESSVLQASRQRDEARERLADAEDALAALHPR